MGADGVKLEKKGMLADLLEREVKKETINGGASVVISADNGLELIAKDALRGYEVDMGVVGVDLPKAAHLIAQVDDSGHVEIHLEEEEAGGAENSTSNMAMCNGQSLLDQLEACEVSSTTDPVTVKALKRPAEPLDDESAVPAVKKAMTNHVSPQLTDDDGIYPFFLCL